MKCLIVLVVVAAIACANQEQQFEVQTIGPPSARNQLNSPFAYGAARPQFRQYGGYQPGMQDSSLYQAQNTQYGFANGGGAGGQHPFGGQFQENQEFTNNRFNDPQGTTQQRWNSASTSSLTLVSLFFMVFTAMFVSKF